MKTMTCKQLGGVCDEKFSAESFEGIAELSKAHGMEMYMGGDSEHIAAINKIMEIMNDTDEMIKWFKGKEEEFEALPED